MAGERPIVERVAGKLHCYASQGWIYRREIYSGKDLPVLEILVPDTLNFKKVVRAFESDFTYNVFFNSDLTPVQMFLFENKLFPLAYGTYSLDETNRLNSVELEDSLDKVDFTLPPLSIMTLCPANSDVAPKYQGIVNLEISYEGRTYGIEANSAEELLDRINDHLKRCDPDIIVTNYGDGMLLPWLADLSRRTRIPINLNRDKEAEYRTTNESSYWTYGQIVHKSGGFMLAGRWHVDAENSFIVGESDLDGLYELSRITQIPGQEQGRSSIGTGLSSMQLSWAYQHNILIPAKKRSGRNSKRRMNCFLPTGVG